MDMYAMGVAMAANAMAGAAQGASGTTQPADTGFAQLLNLATGGSADGTAMAEVDWQQVKAGMMTDTMSTLAEAEKPLVTDPVLAQLLQMLKALSANGEGEANVADLTMLLEQMQKRLEEVATQNGADAAGQQLLAMLSALVQDVPNVQLPQDVMQAMQADGGQAMLDLVLSAEPETLLQMLTSNAQPAVQQEGTAQPFAQAMPQDAAVTDGQNASVKADRFLADVVQVETKTDVAKHEADFTNVIREVKQQMAQVETEAAPKDEAKLDIDKLQQNVDAGAFFKNTALQPTQADVKAEAPQAPIPVETQLVESVEAAIQTGTDELTIKLNPEELGEVTIRLVNTENGMRLDIIAKHENTQRLLAAEVDALKDSLRPLKVEVDNILTQRQDDLLSGQQNFGGRQQDGFQKLQGAAYYKDSPLGTAEELTMAQPIMAGAPTTALDAYI